MMRKMDWSLAYYTLRADIWHEDLLQATFGLGVSGSSPQRKDCRTQYFHWDIQHRSILNIATPHWPGS
jgi:hypothetical protein